MTEVRHPEAHDTPDVAHVDQSWQGVIRWGGLSLAAAGGLLVVFILLVFATGQELPVPAKDILEDPAVPTVLFLIAAVGELLLLPGGLALYLALRSGDRTRMFLASALWLAAIPLFLASRGLIISLSQISDNYLHAANEATRAGYLASAETALETQNIYAATGLTLLSVASIIIGLVMLRSATLGRRTAYLVIAAGAVTIFAPLEVMVGIPVVIPFTGLVLSAAWQVMAGVRLYRMGGSRASIAGGLHGQAHASDLRRARSLWPRRVPHRRRDRPGTGGGDPPVPTGDLPGMTCPPRSGIWP